MSVLTRKGQAQLQAAQHEDIAPEEQPAWLTSLNEKINRIPDIQRSVDLIVKTSIPTLEKSINDINKTLEDIQRDDKVNKVAIKNLNTRATKIEADHMMLTKDLNDTKSRLLYLESQSRRNNLLFHGFKDKKDESWEKSEELVMQYIAQILEIQDVISIERAHRIGKFNDDGAPRPIVVKFSNYKEKQKILTIKFEKDREGILQNSMSNIRIYEDYPPEITANRKKLWPYFKSAKELKMENVSLKLDKLWISGKVYTVDNIDKAPDCLQPQNRCHKQTDDVFLFLGKHSVFSNFHPMQVKIEGVTYKCNEQYFQRAKALFFGDDATALKIMLESDPLAMHALGKKVKGFKKELWKTQSHKVLKHVNEVKFRENPSAADALSNTKHKRIGEASPDPLFGIGLHITSKDATDCSKWTGTNMMGDILTEIRDSLTPK